MYMILFLIAVVGQAWAGNLSVYGNRNYDLSFDKKLIVISSPVINLKFTSEKCNERIFEKFLEKMSYLENDKNLISGFKNDHFNFSVNAKKFHEPMTSAKAKFIDSLPKELERMKIEERLRCKEGTTQKKDKKS